MKIIKVDGGYLVRKWGKWYFTHPPYDVCTRALVTDLTLEEGE